MKTCKLKLFYYVLMPLLCFALVLPRFTIHSLASTTSGDIPETYFGYTIYDSDSLNSQAISEFNNMSDEERMAYCQNIYPIFAKKLGFINTDPYTFCSDEWQEKIVILKNAYSTAEDLYNDRDNVPHWQLYIVYSRGHGWRWYENFSEYLANVITVQDNQLVMNQTSNIYYLIDDAIKNEQEENGVIKVTLKSYSSINSSQFNNLSLYTNFIGLCRENRDKKFVIVTKDNYKIGVAIPSVNVNLYNNGVTLGNTLNFCNDSGQGINSWIRKIAWFPATNFSNARYNFNYNNYKVGGSTVANVDPESANNNVSSGWAIYTLNEQDTEYTVFTSLNGWINHNGHYEPSYELTGIYGTVPSATVNSNNITTYYNNTYTDNSNYNYVYYPPNYDPSSNGYDSEHKILSFDGISNFLASLGELIGSLINGLAQGLANIINSLISVVNNLKQNLLQGVIFEFLSAFMGWLPVEIVTLLTALFAITVIFALIKLIKGFF